MNKSACLICLLCLLLCCGPKQDEVERYIEDGVEVIVNHLEPYKIPGELTTLALEDEISIDTEKDEIAKLGLVDINSYDLDSRGNIYILSLKSKDNCIFKFGNTGNFVSSFANVGQGPGELGKEPSVLNINNKDEILVYNSVTGKVSIYSTSGDLVDEISTDMRLVSLSQLNNGNYLISYFKVIHSGRDVSQRLKLGLFDFEINEIKELAKFDFPVYPKQKKRSAFIDRFRISAGNELIYVCKSNIDYEIWVYDLDGKLVRKIIKTYSPIEVSQEYKSLFLEERKGVLSKEMLDRYYFPKHFPAIHNLYNDEKGRLYVVTFERNKSSGGWMADIFNAEGVFIGRTSLSESTRINPPTYKIRNSHVYIINQKESGYKELVVFKMN